MRIRRSFDRGQAAAPGCDPRIPSTVDLETEADTEREGERERRTPDSISTHAPSWFSDQEREPRRRRLPGILPKERTPAKRAQLYQEYLGEKIRPRLQRSAIRSTAYDILNSSGPGSLIGRPGLGQSRSGAIINQEFLHRFRRHPGGASFAPLRRKPRARGGPLPEERPDRPALDRLLRAALPPAPRGRPGKMRERPGLIRRGRRPELQSPQRPLPPRQQRLIGSFVQTFRPISCRCRFRRVQVAGPRRLHRDGNSIPLKDHGEAPTMAGLTTDWRRPDGSCRRGG